MTRYPSMDSEWRASRAYESLRGRGAASRAAVPARLRRALAPAADVAAVAVAVAVAAAVAGDTLPPASTSAPSHIDLPVNEGNQELARLLGRVALRDPAAFRALYRLTSGHLLGLAVGIVERRDRAEDVLQEAFMNVWHGAAGYRPDVAAPMTWLINIVRNKAIDKLRVGKAERAATVELDDEAMALPDAPERQPQALLEESLKRARIDACMAQLGAAQRQAIALAYYQGLVHTEIAETLGAPLGTVKAWVRRGMDRLKGCLEQAGVSAA